VEKFNHCGDTRILIRFYSRAELDNGGTADVLDGAVILKAKMVSDMVLSTVSDWVKKGIKPESLLMLGHF
jgi:hypothetical protein